MVPTCTAPIVTDRATTTANAKLVCAKLLQTRILDLLLHNLSNVGTPPTTESVQVHLEPALTRQEVEPTKLVPTPTTTLVLRIQRFADPATTAAEPDILPVIVAVETHQTTRDTTTTIIETTIGPTTRQIVKVETTLGAALTTTVMDLEPLWHKVAAVPHQATLS